VKEKNVAARRLLIQKYLKEKGLDEVISEENVICCKQDKEISIEEIIKAMTHRYGEIDAKDIIIGGVQGEFMYDEYGKNYKVLALGPNAACNIGIYRVMIELLVNGEYSNKFLSPDGVRDGWYVYLPDVVPEDYQQLYDEYQQYISTVLTRA